MARVKLICIMGCPGLKSSYREKGLFISDAAARTLWVAIAIDFTLVMVYQIVRG